MKEDKPKVSIKMNGKTIEVEKEEPSKENERVEEPLRAQDIPVADWKEKRVAEEEQAASYSNEDMPKRPSIPYKKIRKKANLPRKSYYHRKKQRTYPLYFISITAGAIALGLLFGMVMLQLFSEDRSSPTNAAFNMEDDPPITADFPDSTALHVLQAGAFTQKEKGVEMQENLHAKGYPAVLTHDGDYYYLFSGVSFQQGALEEVKQFYDQEGLEVYEKSRTIPEPEEREDNTDTYANLQASKEVLTDVMTAVLGQEAPNEGLLQRIDEYLAQTESWEEDNIYGQLRQAIADIKEEWTESEQANSALYELLIESSLYYEEAVYHHNETDDQVNTGNEEE
ncbi:hypothetical protein SAMN05192534_11670 [Alteribacillus persepolensis]|uniref:SPOR domain-containing protein n=1 Tax=Alteribacillus persepolensis TaxID=568899 RepID=A0A1G8GPK4_9BACI|nr:hypothetical protein [Alteribacillus persepolensis]SDH96345.1 hypothetical protein SAMN05192534_11670 [Alteribacillus persepolensis]